MSDIHLVRANAQLGEDELNPKKSFVAEELHFATIPFVDTVKREIHRRSLKYLI